MNRYEKGKIYKITDVGYTECYIGSTCDKLLSQRFSRHKEQFKRYGLGKANWSYSFALFEKFGIGNCKIELIEEYPCENRHQLNKREGMHIRETNCVNKQIAGRTKADYKAEFREWYLNRNKMRYQNNREEILEKSKETIVCECGSIVRKDGLQRHYKTVKRQSK